MYMETLPTNPQMLVSAINMLLRDGAFDSLEALCAYYDRDQEALLRTLAAAGFEYLPEQKRFF